MAKNYYRDIFELDGMPPFSQFWAVGIARWQEQYRGARPRIIACPTVANEKHTRPMATLCIVKAVAQEIANMVTAEPLRVQISGRTDEATAFLQGYLDEALERNNLQQELGKLIEQMVAVGGMAISSWVDGERNEDGDIIGNPHIRLRYYPAQDFVPVKWSSADVSDAILISHEARRGNYYTRLEIHERSGTTYAVRNRLFRSEANNILGIECPLSELYGMSVMSEVRIDDCPGSLFAYAPNIAKNNIDFNSPLGISAFAGCADTIAALDTAFDSFGREFVLGRKRILVPSSCIRTVRDSQGQEHRYFDANDEAYEVLYADNPESLKIQDNTVSLRVDEHIAAINALLDVLAFQVGLSQGALSFDKIRGMKTATEVASDNAKTYRYVKRLQAQVASSVKKIIRNILDLSALYEVEYQGVSVASVLSQGFTVSVSFEDGIIQDDAEKRATGIAMVNAGLISKFTFLTDYMHYTDEAAERELERVKAETPTSSLDMTSLFGA